MSFDATFDGVAASSLGFRVLKANRSALPQMRDYKVDIPGRPGSYVFSATPGDRKIIVTLGIDADDAADYIEKMRALAGWLWTGGKKHLVFSDEPDKYWNACVAPADSLELERDVEIGVVDVEFTADAYAYSVTPGYEEWDTATASTLTVTNNGTVDSYVRFLATATEAVQSPRFKLGNALLVAPSLSVGQTLDVFGPTRSIFVDGVSNWTGVSGEFFDLAPGENVLEYASTSGHLDVEVFWQPAWL